MKRFFCENCGKEVQERDELCQHCAAIFVAIKCPQCGFRGKQHLFRRGCPVCGFLSEETPVISERRQFEHPETLPERREKRYARSRAPVPEWVFWVALAGLVLAFILVSRIYLRLGL